MDALNPSAQPTFASRTPLRIGGVTLAVRDLERMHAYYRDLLGLAQIDRSADAVRLGAGGVTFLELQRHADARPDDQRTAGLYHTAFLMPTRGDLARWLQRIAQNRVPVTGVSDHLVSEAIYLDDPEGNGVEVYSDRAPETWHRHGDLIEITTDPLDIDNLLQAAGDGAAYDGAPDGLRVGHVHLRVGDVAQAEKFYRDTIGLTVTRSRQGASFMSSGGYHHHIATNVWHSRGAGPRDPDRAGLAWFSFEADKPALDAAAARLKAAGAPVTVIAGGIETSDPWGTRIKVTT